MCLDISFKIDITEDSLYDYLPGLKTDPQLSVDFSGSAHVQAHSRPKTRIILAGEDGHPRLTTMRWGVLMKFMFRDPVSFNKYANNMYNARAENIFEPRSAWHRIRSHRCLIDTPGIYEHRAIPGWKHKVPYYIRLRNRKRMLIPALYFYPDLQEEDIERIKAVNDKQMIGAVSKVISPETGEITGTFAMITREGNKLMQQIHNDGTNRHRMPLFLQPEKAVQWIEPGLSDAQMKAILETEIASRELEAWPVFSIRGASPRPDGLEKSEPWNWPALPSLGHEQD